MYLSVYSFTAFSSSKKAHIT